MDKYESNRIHSPRVVHLPRYKCFARIFENRLEICRAPNGEANLGSENDYRRWEPVKHPVGQEFLDQVNQAFETKYTEREFQVESWNEKGRIPGYYLK